MDLMSKYKWFKQGLVQRNTSVLLQKFFRTEPTEEQLLLLDKINNDNTGWLGITILFAKGGI